MKIIVLDDGYNGQKRAFFAEPIARDGHLVKLRCAEPGKEFMTASRHEKDLAARDDHTYESLSPGPCNTYPVNAEDTMKIIRARITRSPETMLDFFLPDVYVVTEDNVEHHLFNYYPDEITFRPEEFVGLTLEQARRLKVQKDRTYLTS